MGSVLTGWVVPASNCSSRVDVETEQPSTGLYSVGSSPGTSPSIWIVFCFSLDQKLLFTLQNSHEMPNSQRLSSSTCWNGKSQIHAIRENNTTNSHTYRQLQQAPTSCSCFLSYHPYPSAFRGSSRSLQRGPRCLLRSRN